jgi:hypothetical protein
MQNPSGLGFEIWVSRKDPTAVLPRTDSVVVKPSLDAGVAEGCPLRPQARHGSRVPLRSSEKGVRRRDWEIRARWEI